MDGDFVRIEALVGDSVGLAVGVLNVGDFVVDTGDCVVIVAFVGDLVGFAEGDLVVGRLVPEGAGMH